MHSSAQLLFITYVTPPTFTWADRKCAHLSCHLGSFWCSKPISPSSVPFANQRIANCAQTRSAHGSHLERARSVRTVEAITRGTARERVGWALAGCRVLCTPKACGRACGWADVPGTLWSTRTWHSKRPDKCDLLQTAEVLRRLNFCESTHCFQAGMGSRKAVNARAVWVRRDRCFFMGDRFINAAAMRAVADAFGSSMIAQC